MDGIKENKSNANDEALEDPNQLFKVEFPPIFKRVINFHVNLVSAFQYVGYIFLSHLSPSPIISNFFRSLCQNSMPHYFDY
jgi:hypothetical protein